MSETLEEFRRRLHCTHTDPENVERWYWEVKQELADANKKVAGLEAELKQEAIFRNELKLTAMGWQDEPEENCHLCECAKHCGDQLLEFVVSHEKGIKK